MSILPHYIEPYLHLICMSCYTAKNATDLMRVRVVDFPALMQFANKLHIKPVDFIKLHQVFEHQTCCKLMNLLALCKPACCFHLVASLLTTCNRLVIYDQAGASDANAS